MPTPEELQMAAAQQPETFNQSIGPEASQSMLQPDPEVRLILISRLESLTPEELKILDRIIDGNSARILLKLLPELKDLVEISVSRKAAGDAGAGALAGM
jgi:hypothetical protein